MRAIFVVIFTLIVLGFFNYSIYEKEQIIAKGEPVYVELAPVDPRSLIQGDYMRLAYKIERSHRSKKKEKFKEIVITTDENQIAQFVRFHRGKPLAENEKTLKVQKVYSRYRILPNSFLFQEGHRKHYEQAKYGVYKFDNKNNYILIGLADKDRKLIQPE